VLKGRDVQRQGVGQGAIEVERDRLQCRCDVLPPPLRRSDEKKAVAPASDKAGATAARVR
jgi:hypothetical protein